VYVANKQIKAKEKQRIKAEEVRMTEGSLSKQDREKSFTNHS